MCQRNRRKIPYVQSRLRGSKLNFFSIGHTPGSGPRRVALVCTRYNFSACCRWRISISAAVRPADIADHHKTIIVVECIWLWRRYNLPGLAACLSTGWTRPRLTLHPTLYTLCARPATFITITSARKNDLQLFMAAREINIYTIRAPNALPRCENKFKLRHRNWNVTGHRYYEHYWNKT